MLELMWTEAMLAINCPILGYEYITEDVDSILPAAQLNTHTFAHQQGENVTASIKQKPLRNERPAVSRISTGEEWHTFLQRWNLFKRGTDIPRKQISNQPSQWFYEGIEEDLFQDITNVSDTDQHVLLAVISTAASVRKAELLAMRQGHGQPIRSFAAKVKGKAEMCAFGIVDYTEDIVKYVVIPGIADEEIKKGLSWSRWPWLKILEQYHFSYWNYRDVYASDANSRL